MRTGTRLGICLLAFATLPVGRAFGQAWVGDKGTGSLSAEYSFSSSGTIIENSDNEFADTGITSHIFILQAGYNPIDRLGLTLSLPFIASKYTGTSPFPAHGTYDNGSLHGTLQDLALRVRYQLPIDAVAITPQIGFSLPVSDYETFGFANAGRHLKTFLIGASIGKMLLDDKMFLHLTYELGVPESFKGKCPDNWADPNKPEVMPCDELSDFSQLRSDLAFQAGYFITNALQAHLALDGHWQHGGIDYTDPRINGGTPDMVLLWGHDAILHESFIDAGLGLGYDVTDAVSLEAEFRTYLTGKNTRNTKTFIFGASWDFGG